MKATSRAIAVACALAASLALGAPPRKGAGPTRLPRRAPGAEGATYEQVRLSGGATRDVTSSNEIEEVLREKERLVGEKRRQAIGLLEVFLAEHRGAPEEAEALFQLAELKWEESKASFLVQMAAYNAAVEKCAREKCRNRPEQPALHLEGSQKIYVRLIGEHPDFKKIDAVRYLLGFSLREQGRLTEALVQFKKIIEDFPESRFRPDAWMAVAEARFYDDGDYRGALSGYNEVLKFPDSPLYDLALFKTAWCMWKSGDTQAAARRFKEVLDLGGTGREKGYHQGKEGQKRLKELQSEALDYLVQIFTDDETKGPKDCYDFLAGIGGAQYGKRVLNRLGETFATQARYQRAIETERFLIGLDPTDLEDPVHQRRIVDAYRQMDDGQSAVQELRKLAEDYAPQSDWAKKNADHPDEIQDARDDASKMLREVAKDLHGQAQANEKAQRGHPDMGRYERAAEAYAYYLAHFGDEKAAVEIHELLAEIYFFKLKKFEDAGDAFLAVGKSKPVGKLHKEALLNAMSAYEKVRQETMAKNPTLRSLLPSDKKMGEAMDLFADLFPNDDKEIVNIILRNGELFYDYRDYDEAVKRFGTIVEKYPRSPQAGEAGEKILDSLNKAKDYSNIEGWARRLLKVPAFKAKPDQDRLKKLVLDAGFKAGEQKAEKEPLEAAKIFERVAGEFPQSDKAPKALANAATTLLTAGKPEQAVADYGKIVDGYPQSPEAALAAWSAGKLYEQAALWDQAARFYELLADRYPKDANAPFALYNAGLLREHLAEPQAAILRYTEYAKRFAQRDDAGEVAFRVGVVLQQTGQKEQAAKAFLDCANRFKGERAVDALARAGEALIEAGADRRAAEALERAVRAFKQSPGHASAKAAAHARYLQGELVFKEFERIKFDADPRKLKGSLEKKSKKLEEARAIYLDAVSFKDPEWATAALYRIGDAYEKFAGAMRGAPIPKELKEDEQQVYREELEKVVVVIEEKAIDAYKSGYEQAQKLGVYNEFTQKLRQALGRLNDQEFPPEKELREGHAPAEVVALPPLVERVRR